MKKFISIIVAVINIVVNLFGYLTTCLVLAKSELFHLGSFKEMVNPDFDWWFNNPGVMLFAYNAHKVGMMELIVSLITIVLTVVYLRLKREEILDSIEYDSKNVMLTVISISLCLSALLTAICSIPMYNQIPMSIVFILLSIVIYKFAHIEKLLYRMGLGKQEDK